MRHEHVYGAMPQPFIVLHNYKGYNPTFDLGTRLGSKHSAPQVFPKLNYPTRPLVEPESVFHTLFTHYRFPYSQPVETLTPLLFA